MKILGLSGAIFHDASAALVVDGEIIAAAEEERFVREKHAKGRFPIEAAKWCLDFSGIKASEIDAVAFPYASIDLKSPARWHFAKRYWYATERSIDALFNGNRRFVSKSRNIHFFSCQRLRAPSKSIKRMSCDSLFIRTCWG